MESVNETSPYNPLSREVLTFYQAAIGSLAVLGTFSNSLACVAVCSCPRLRNSGNVFIANMSATGAVYCGVILPVRLATLVYEGWTWSAELCVFFGSLAQFFGGAIAFFFAAIAANRLVYIRYPRHYFKMYGHKGAAIQIVSIWLLCLALCLVLPLSGLWGTLSYYPTLYCCTFSADKDLSYKYFITSFGLYVPTIFVAICYLLIFAHVREAQRRLDRWGTLRRRSSNKVHAADASTMVASTIENSSTAASSNNGTGNQRFSTSPGDYGFDLSPNKDQMKCNLPSETRFNNEVESNKGPANYVVSNHIGSVHTGPGMAPITYPDKGTLTSGKGPAHHSLSEETISANNSDDLSSNTGSVIYTLSTKDSDSVNYTLSKDTWSTNYGHLHTADIFNYDLTPDRNLANYGLSPGMALGDEPDQLETQGSLEIIAREREAAARGIVMESHVSIYSSADDAATSDNAKDAVELKVSIAPENQNKAPEKKHKAVRFSTPKESFWMEPEVPKPRVPSPVFTKKQRKEGLRMTAMMVGAFVMCMACTLPYYVASIMDDRPNFPLGYMIAIISISLAITLNPVVYALMNVHYRRAYKVILKACFQCRLNNNKTGDVFVHNTSVAY